VTEASVILGEQRQARTVAILSPYFPPATLAGVHRARHLAKHLPALGWTPIIVRAHERHYTERLDPALALLMPKTIEQVKTDAIPAKVTRLVGIGDIGLRGFLAFRSALTAISRSKKLDAVLITGSPFYPMLLARYLREQLNLPVILDFQDPWVSAEAATREKWTKGGIAYQIALVMEPRAVRYANFITSVSERQNVEMAHRYPWLCRDQMAAIPIGGDPDDFLSLRNWPSFSSTIQMSPDKINLSYVGTFLPRAENVVRTILRALHRLKITQPELAQRIRLNFVGTSNQPNITRVYPVQKIAQEEAVDDLVIEVPQRVPYLEALSLLAISQGLLLVGSDEPHYTASKIYPALMSARPYLSVFHEESSAHRILARAGGGRSFAFSTADELRCLVPQISSALADFASGAHFDHPDKSTYTQYLAENVAAAFADVLDSVCRRGRE
jgi:hypothetical protein